MVTAEGYGLMTDNSSEEITKISDVKFSIRPRRQICSSPRERETNGMHKVS